MDQGSSWARAPPRDLGPKPKEEPHEWDGVYNPIPTFQPEMVSAPELRQKARSSGYGKEVPRIQRVDLGPDDKRPWDQEPEPTFRPELPDNELRKSVSSSGYGKALPAKKEPKVETPKFQPELQRSSSGKKMARTVSSSGYGKVAASPSRPSSAPTATFRPQLPKSRLRSSVKSSSYGKVAAQARPTTAPQNGSAAGGFNTTPSKPKYVPRYSLLADRSDKEVYPEESKPVKEFVLDGLYTSTTRSRLEDSFGADDFKPSPHQQQLRQSVASSGYTKTFPRTGPRPEPKQPEPRLTFDRSRSVLDEYLIPHAPKTPLADKVRSSAYGKASPLQGRKPEPKPQEPQWNMTYKAALNNELPPTPRSALNDKVGSHGYGKVSPQKAPRYQIEPEPLWVPTNNPRVKLAAPPPVPRSKIAAARGHYGRDYDPTSLYAFNGTGEFDEELDGSNSIMRRTIIRRTVDGVTTEEVVEESGNGAAEEEEEFEAY